MKILLTGCDGQLGFELQRSVPSQHELIAIDRQHLDITDQQAVLDYVTEQQPQLIINGAAYTAVDLAEKEQAIAVAVNHQGADNLAQAAKNIQAKMIQISTDFIFSGKNHQPYTPNDKPEPISVYGQSKYAGDQAVLNRLGDQACIIRTSWLYSSHGNNFVKTMLRLMQERDELGIVADQIGTPTWAATLSETIWQAINVEIQGIYHCADNGVASWYDFAMAIHEEALALGLLKKKIMIKPLRTVDYPTPAKRPSYSVMDKTQTENDLNITFPYWRNTLQNMLKEL
ncbi:MAG: dTDP-4-dehydrorhamnose reductase [Thiotrichaceae bacterium]|nr:dTDP-4-dehydrorhamnose reductase [Thiotrichaceae bacterium]